MLKSSRDKNEGAYRSGEGGIEPATNVSPDLSYNWERGREYECEDKKWDEEKKT